MTEIKDKNEYIEKIIKEDFKSPNSQPKEIDKETTNDKNTFKIGDDINKNDINTVDTINQEYCNISEEKNEIKDINIIKDNNINKNYNNPIPVKVVLLGTGVEKTRLIKQLSDNYFDIHKETSLSSQFISKIIEFPEYKKSLRFDIWDTAGQEKYRSLSKIFYKDAQVIIFVYDITLSYSFDELKNYWYKEVKENCNCNPVLAVVADNINLVEKQVVSNEDGRAFAKEIGAIFQLTSSKNNDGIYNLFELIGKNYLDPNFDFELYQKKIEEDYIRRYTYIRNNKMRIKLEDKKLKNAKKKCA